MTTVDVIEWLLGRIVVGGNSEFVTYVPDRECTPRSNSGGL
jgi:hypothetical protein